MTRSELGYQDLMRLTSTTVTPAIIINTILGLLEISFPYETLLYFLIAMGYLFFAVKANEKFVKTV